MRLLAGWCGGVEHAGGGMHDLMVVVDYTSICITQSAAAAVLAQGGPFHADALADGCRLRCIDVSCV